MQSDAKLKKTISLNILRKNDYMQNDSELKVIILVSVIIWPATASKLGELRAVQISIVVIYLDHLQELCLG